MRKFLDYDNEVGIGWGPFKLPNDHPFFPAAQVHDWRYDDLIAGTSEMTLKQADREMLRNMLRIAAAEGWKTKDPGEFAKLAREAWMFYGIVRAWAKLVRPDLEAYKPKK